MPSRSVNALQEAFLLAPFSYPGLFGSRRNRGRRKRIMVDGLEIISLPASAFADLQHGRCRWLVPDMAGGVPDAYECEAPVAGRRCAVGHLQIGGVAALNWERLELN
jgi:predicted acylesterase/phospholipase RssA